MLLKGNSFSSWLSERNSLLPYERQAAERTFMSYLFKDTDRAAQRLQVLANVFAGSSRPFMQEVVSTVPQLAVDLGCGPGYTTHLLADITQCIQAVGLDSSEHFFTLAASSTTERISFIHHDVTRIPFPTGQCDLIFCCMLLTQVISQLVCKFNIYC
jgi:SAM-dependent methyltransferase